MKRGRPKCTICGRRYWCAHPRAAGACGKCFENPKRMRELLASDLFRRVAEERTER